MRRLLFNLFLVGLFSCGGKIDSNNQDISEEISYNIDTVIIDAGDQFLYLSEALGRSYLSKNGKTLYNLNQKVPHLEVIDLSILKLNGIIPMEREGPVGIGAYNFYDKVQVLENGEIFIFAWDVISKLSADRKSVEKFRFSAENLKGDRLEEDEEIKYEGIISEDGKSLFTFYGKSNEPSSRLGLALIDLDKMGLRKVELPLFQELKKFEIKTEKEPYAKYPYIYVLPIFLTQSSDQLLVSSSAFNEVYKVDISSGTYSHLTFSSSITANEIELKYSTEARSSFEAREAIREIWKQVSFRKFVWDQQTKKYWRLTNQMEINEEDESTDNVTLTFFDQYLNQKGEVSLPENWRILGAPLISQGMYWQFLNIDDEVAFVRFKPEIK
ncbi:protein of unknown function [Algoriphagus ornithinivorans]|uniref:DUF4221 domain-containing protein n=1 Tax=Algoriphagus ornithinivorans TaxID=226506 RepID=A0A1I5G455_9BACT|nr:DUF4221 family protein [Algoriphagus ornithinivorans]SFO30752.1 protein of unknown function [Algoriphagus ornithinivorans]